MDEPSAPTRTYTGRLALADDVFFCFTQGQGIFLDLKRDDYIAIPIAIGPTDQIASDLSAAIASAFETHRQDLLNAELVEEDAQDEGDLTVFKTLARPSSSIFYPDDQRAFGMTRELGAGIRIGVRDVFDFLLASHRASRLLEKRRIQDVVHGVRRRKAAAKDVRADLDALRRHTAIYRKLRPWYPRGYLCLYDGLALLEFLARRKLFPDWIFGVQAQPFGAHCWVQQGEVLLNESTEYAGQFTPIMAV